MSRGAEQGCSFPWLEEHSTHQLMPQRNTQSPLFLRAFAVILGLCVLICAGCTCEAEKSKVPGETPLPPLKILGTPESIQAELYPIAGSTKKSPIVLVLSKEQHYCVVARSKFEGRAHVLCPVVSADGGVSANPKNPNAEVSTRDALVFMKKQYAHYLDSAPVLLIADPFSSELAFKMMLGEPGFFAHAYLGGLDSGILTNTLLAALHGKGAKTLILDGTMDAKLQLLSTAAGRAHLSLHTVGTGPEALPRALALLLQADPRLGSSK